MNDELKHGLNSNQEITTNKTWHYVRCVQRFLNPMKYVLFSVRTVLVMPVLKFKMHWSDSNKKLIKMTFFIYLLMLQYTAFIVSTRSNRGRSIINTIACENFAQARGSKTKPKLAFILNCQSNEKRVPHKRANIGHDNLALNQQHQIHDLQCASCILHPVFISLQFLSCASRVNAKQMGKSLD